MHDREWVRTGTSELVRGRVSVDMGMCIKKARVKGSRHTCVAVHMCVNVGRVCRWGKVRVLPLLGANPCRKHRNGDCPWVLSKNSSLLSSP